MAHDHDIDRRTRSRYGTDVPTLKRELRDLKSRVDRRDNEIKGLKADSERTRYKLWKSECSVRSKDERIRHDAKIIKDLNARKDGLQRQCAKLEKAVEGWKGAFRAIRGSAHIPKPSGAWH